MKGFSGRIKTSKGHVSGGDDHSCFVVIAAGLCKQFSTGFDGFWPQTTKGFFPHGSARLLLTDKRLIAREVVGLYPDKQVQVFVVSCRFNQMLEFVSSFKENSTFPSFIGVQVKSKASQMSKTADGKKPCHQKDQLTDGNKQPNRQQAHTFIEIIGFQRTCKGHEPSKLFVTHENQQQDRVAREPSKSKRELPRLSRLFSPYFTGRIQNNTEHATKGLPTQNQVSSQFKNKGETDDGDVEGEIQRKELGQCFDEFPVEEDFRNQVNAYEDGIPNNATIIQHLFCIGRVVEHHVQDGQNAVEGGDGHGEEKEDQEEGKDSTNESVFIRVNGVFSTSSGSPFVDQQHVPRGAHDAAVSEDGWCHEGQHGEGDPCWGECSVQLHAIGQHQQRYDDQQRKREDTANEVSTH